MKSIYHSRASATEPKVPTSVTSEGFPTNGSATGGQLATIIGAYWYHMITMELQNAISGGGIAPSANDLSQLDKSIKNQIGVGIDNLRDALQKSIDDISAKVAQRGIPTGTILPFDLDSAPDEFWIPCDGRAVSRSTYSALFSCIGTRHGSGNGETTFNVPNLVGRVLWGANSGIGGLLDAGLPNITGRVGNFNGYASQATAYGAFFDKGNGGFVGIKHGSWDNAHEVFFDASRSSGIYGRSGTVQPPAMKTLFCIHV